MDAPKSAPKGPRTSPPRMAPAAVSPAPEGRLGFWSAERAAFSSSSLSYLLLLLFEDCRIVMLVLLPTLGVVRDEAGAKDDAFWIKRDRHEI